MEQLYMIEIFVDRVTVFVKEGDESTASKNLTTRIKFGPATQFIIKEGQLAVNEENGKHSDDIIETTETGRQQWTRIIRVGKSFLFPSFPDTLMLTLSKCPLELDVWNDDDSEPDYKIYVGVGIALWHTHFFHYLKETMNACKTHQPLSIKEIVTLYEECCCGQAGEVSLILRLSALGNSIVTEFQQLLHDPNRFCFRTDKAPSMFECKRIEGDDPNFCMVGSLYETATLEDPDALANAQKKIEICTELQSCGIMANEGKTVCHKPSEAEKPKEKYAINKIRMGDITGPCGNTNCPLAHKIRVYIRNLDTYKIKAGKSFDIKADVTRKICGTCICKDDRWHREDCLDRDKKAEQVVCSGCLGKAALGDTCEDRKAEHFGTGVTPNPSKENPQQPKSQENAKQVQYVTEVATYRDAIFKRNYVVENCYNITQGYINQENVNCGPSTSRAVNTPVNAGCCGCQKTPNNDCTSKSTIRNNSIRAMGKNTPCVYNAEVIKDQQNPKTFNICTEIMEERECRCNPPIPTPPCKTFDCTCIPKTINAALRKAHRPYCPLYVHKTNCPVTMKNEEDTGEKKEDDEDETEPLPYGLPPIRLGPCPVLGRPCSVPDGFARMYKTAVLPTQPPSYSDAGKVCCSKEYERIKKAIKDYMKYQKENDLRCINRFNVDTEKRCCDKEQILKSLMGRECCGTHKLAIQEKYKEQSSQKQ